MDTNSTELVTQFGPVSRTSSLVFQHQSPQTILYLSNHCSPYLLVPTLADDDTVDFLAGRRNVEGGPRFGELRHTTYRGVFGIRGELDDTWRYDVSYQYSEVDMANLNGNYFDTARLNQALKAELDADGNIVCSAGADAGCVPYNLWTTGGVTDDQVAFLSQEYFESGSTSQEVFMAYAQGSLGNYGIASPLADSGVEVVIGFEYRDETLDYDASDNAKRGTVGGLGAAVNPVSGAYDVNELYIEANVPVIENAALAKSVVLDLGYRYSDYSTGAETDTYRIAGNWAINDTVRVRGGFNRAVRAANIVDLFQPVSGGLFAMDTDPCKRPAGDTLSVSGYTFEQCARTGVSQAIWDQGGPANNPASQYNQIGGGSTELDPEEADTYTAGVILTPSFLDGLTVAVDWYDIEVESAITGIAAETTLLQCLETGSDQFCNAVGRGQNDTLWLGLAPSTVSTRAQRTSASLPLRAWMSR